MFFFMTKMHGSFFARALLILKKPGAHWWISTEKGSAIPPFGLSVSPGANV
jgi:hypothetical protein